MVESSAHFGYGADGRGWSRVPIRAGPETGKVCQPSGK